ncbi:MAG: leucine-rich repeat domain-containing protein, partial [Spirochaetales bacterium]|nr:leucine-rich repeat domain-containing protein [Spirochaetales bacterium]
TNDTIMVDLDMSRCECLTTVKTEAFIGCSNLTSVTIPDSVTSIGIGAFSGCSGLTSITIPFVGDKPHTSTDTYQYPFGYIFGTDSYEGGTEMTQSYYGSSTSEVTSTIYYIPTSLKSVTITESSYIPYGAFYNCSGLTGGLMIPNSVTSIGGSAFYNCSGLTGGLTIPNSVTSIGGSAFYNCSGLTGSLTIPNSVTNIGTSAFRNCRGLTNVTIGSGVKSIGDYAFYGCSGLTSVTIPNSVTSIGQYAFYGCSGLMSVEIPNSVSSIGESAFGGCRSLESITIPVVGYRKMRSSTDTYQYPFGYIFGTRSYTGGTETKQYDYVLSTFGATTSISETTQTTYYIPTSLKRVTIGNRVTSIYNNAFINCSVLTSVTIPNSVTSIGGGAFSGCSGLTTLNVKATTPPSIGGNMLKDCFALTTIYVPTASVSTYKAASGWWSSYKDKIVGKDFE